MYAKLMEIIFQFNKKDCEVFDYLKQPLQNE